MSDKNKRLSILNDVVSGIAVGDTDAAKTAFHKYVTSASRAIAEGEDPKSNPGDSSVKATMKAAGDKEIKATGDAKDDPKKAPGDSSVKATMKAAGDKEIK